MRNAKEIFNRFVEVIWYLLLFSLPITSMPLVAKITGTDYVSPASGVFLLFLIILWLVPFIIRTGRLQKQINPLIFFTICAIVSTAAGFFIYMPPYKDFSILGSSAKGLITLIIGISYYTITSTFVRNKKILLTSLKLINLSGLLFMIWSFAQALAWKNSINENYPALMISIQKIFSTSKLFWGRTTGFALEPSWLAHQLNMLYLPYWLASTINNFSAHKFRLWKIPVETILLLAGMINLVLTLSRGGWAAFLLMLATAFVVINYRLFHWFKKKINLKSKYSPGFTKFILTVVSICVIAVYMAFVTGLGLYALNFDKRMQNIFAFEYDNQNLLLRLANTLSFGERVVYWIAGWSIFNANPLLGVGLGNAGYFIPSGIIPYGWQLTEIRHLVFHSPQMLNIKSIWFRLPAETGMVGLAFFLTWLYILLRTSIYLTRTTKKEDISIGYMGLFMLSAFIMEGISIDSFAMPYLWITTGLVTAVFGIQMILKKNNGIADQ